MKTLSFLLFVVAIPLPLTGQEAPPSDFAAAEIARSRTCVPGLTRLTELDARLEPLARRADRIQVLNEAVAMEDSLRATPFVEGDTLEGAVRDWFTTDLELATAGNDEATEAERTRARQAIRTRLAEAMQAVNIESAELVQAADIGNAAFDCDGAILVRSAVVEACAGASSVVCDEARASEPGGRFRFVDAPEDLWDVEELRPWTAPTPIRRSSETNLAGGRTAAFSRRGNLVLVVTLEAMIVERSEISEEQAAGLDEHLSTMGFNFESARFAMAPVLGLHLEAPAEPLGGETHYLLHFGNLEDPANDVIWSGPVAGGLLETQFMPDEQTLARLVGGEIMSMTAVRFLDEETAEGDAIYTLDIPTVGQGQSVRGLLTYMAGGQLSRDLAAIVPPSAGDRP